MKKIVFSIATLFCLTAMEAQLKVNSTGKLGLHGISTPLSDLHLKGNALFTSVESGMTSAPMIRGGNAYSSAWAPDYMWWGDTQTGFYHPANEQVGLSISTSSLLLAKKDSLKLMPSHWTGGLKLANETFSCCGMVTLQPNTPWYGALGTSTNYFGAAYIGHIFYSNLTVMPSDERLKQNVRKIDSGIETIRKLNPVKYDIKSSMYQNTSQEMSAKLEKEGQNTLGFIAQELQNVLPELVDQEPGSGMYGIDMMGLIPVLVQAVKEQQIQIESLQYQVSKLKNDSANARLGSREVLVGSHLNQNSPNPFTQSTSVTYHVDQNASTVSIMIFDMAGTLLRTYDDLAKGESSITIDAGELNAGMYMYSLLVNGVELDTKRMILTK